jgi:endonuclease YncB( thermonuclease family)
MYDYRAKVTRVLDGDTVEVEWLDLGFGMRMHSTKKRPLRLRFADADAYETTLREETTPAQKALGLEAKAWLTGLLPAGSVVRLRSTEVADTFGRILAIVWMDGPDDDVLVPTQSLGAEILRRGWGTVYAGK